MKSLKDYQFSLRLLSATLRDAEQILSVSLEEDLSFLTNAFNQKGIEFVRDLSTLGKSIERSLITGQKLVVNEDVFQLRDGENLPEFLYQLTSPLFSSSGVPRYILVYDNASHSTKWHVQDSDGRWHSLPTVAKNAHCVFLLRQILLSFSKAIDLECPALPSDELAAFRARLERVWSPKPGMSLLLSTARCLLWRVLMESDSSNARINARFANWVTQPFGRHGPGAVASREKGSQKWNFTVDPLRVARELYEDAHGNLIGRELPGAVYTARASIVPKDFRGNRIICVEPKELQFAQQGLLQIMEDLLKNHPLTRRHIALDNQERSFYRSRSYDYATIDLKDASDRISLSLAKILLPKKIFDLVTRYRSTHVLVDGVSVRSRAFLTMGNALCFPFETLIFWALTCASILTEDGRFPPFDEDLERVADLPISVFGDDIIVPASTVDWVVGSLTDCGLVINREKTCKNTLVRESCGSWYYSQKDCRIQRFKFCRTLNLQSWVSFMPAIPQLRDFGLLNTAGVLECVCDEIYPIPSFFLKFGLNERNSRTVRFNPKLQRMEYLLPCGVQDNPRALIGRLGLTAWWTNAAIRVSYPGHSDVIKYEWVAI